MTVTALPQPPGLRDPRARQSPVPHPEVARGTATPSCPDGDIYDPMSEALYLIDIFL